MSDHYYSPDPQSTHRPARLSYAYRGCSLSFHTDSGVFSRLEIDKGTEILLNALPYDLSGSVLDMGCGYGVIGVSLGKAYPACRITMVDINQRAVDLARQNADENSVAATIFQSDGYHEIPPEKTYACILQNPPIRAGKQTIYQMFAQGAARLKENGVLWLVIRKQQGAPSAMTYLQSLFHQVSAPEKKSGYWILRCSSPKNSQEKGITSHEL